MTLCDHGFDAKTCALPSLRGAKCSDNFAASMNKLAENLAVAPIEITNSVPVPADPVIVRKTDEITDPAAKNVLQLAQEYAEAQNKVATIRAVVASTRAMLAAAETDLAAAELSCGAKQRVLAEAVTPNGQTTTASTTTG